MNKFLLKNCIKNCISSKTKRHIVAFFVDDYGSVRTKDINAYERLKQMGVPMDTNRYSKFDTLASAEDLEMLFDVLTSVKDKNGRFACMTPFANIANPDFLRIKESGFSNYYRESFVDTLARYGSKYDGVLELWKQGIAASIFRPEYHGTEHINIPLFMYYLQSGHQSSRMAFDNECVCVPPLQSEQPAINVAKNSYYKDESQIGILHDSIVCGIEMFNDILGYHPTQFTPGASWYSDSIEKTLFDNGITCINTEHSKKKSVNRHTALGLRYTGQKNSIGIKYLIRNCVFEPYTIDCSRNEAVVANCLTQINAAFLMKTPAIISSHRVNYVGELEPSHRNDSLNQLKILLKEIVKRWPDVEFLNGTELGCVI